MIEHAGDPDAEVLVLAPALNSRLRHWVSDVDDAVRAAEQRMSVTIDELRRHGLSVIGQAGDSDPLEAMADALATFPASTIMISTWPAGASNRLEKNLPRRTAERFGLPVNHIVSPYDAPAAAA